MALNIKVEWGAAQKMFRFNQEMTIFEVCKQIREKLNIEGVGSDHGMFQPAEGARMGRWLKPERTLMYYDMKSNDLVQYKKKHRALKVKLIDETVKTVLVDDSLLVWEIVDTIGEKLSIKNAEEYSLARVDGSGWLHPNQPLVEQGIEEKDTLLLKKKFFVTDQSVDRGDPIQLHLVFIQCRDMIVSGQTPCQYVEATSLASLLLQVELGNYSAQRDIKGSLREKMQTGKLVAPGFIKQYGFDKLEKDIFVEYKKLTGMNEINAKFRFVQLCRSLKTYGITCFEVQQKGKGKKMENILIGVTKDAIYRMDVETKEIVKTNQLTQLKRWAASPKSFTLDFGDYESDYYTVATTEGEALSQLISGYIDIILKRRKDTGRVETEDDTIKANEEFVAPVRANALETMTTSIGSGAYQSGQAQEGMISGVLGQSGAGGGGPNQVGGRGVVVGKSGVGGGGKPITDLESAEAALNSLAEELEAGVPWARMPSELTPEQWKTKMQDAFVAGLKSVNELMKNAQNPDKNALNALARGIYQNVNEMVFAARMAASENDDDISLLESAKLVSEAVGGILRTVKDLNEHPGDPGLEAKLTNAAKILQAAQLNMTQALKGQLLTDPISEELILASARAVADASRELKNVAEAAAKSIPDPLKRDELNKAIDNEDNTAQFAYQTARALAAVMMAPGAKQTVEEANKALQYRLGELSKFGKAFVSDPSLLEKMAAATKNVNDAIAQLALANEVALSRDQEEIPEHAKTIHEGVELIEKHEGQKAEISKGVNNVAKAGVALVGVARQTAQLLDPAAQERLLASAKALSEAIASAGGAAKPSLANPNDRDAYRKLLDAVKRVRDAADGLVDDAGKAVAFKALQHAAKHAVAETTDLVGAARAASQKASDKPTQHRLGDEAAKAYAALQRLLDAVRNAQAKPDSLADQNKLLSVAQQTALPATALVATAKGAIPRVDDMATKMALNQSSAGANKALQELLAAIRRVAEATGAKDVDQAQQEADIAVMGSEALLLSAEVGMLEPTGAELDRAVQRLQAAAAVLGKAAGDLRETAVTNPERIGYATRSVGGGVHQVAEAAKEVAYNTGDKTVQTGVLAGSKTVGQKTKEQIDAARARMLNPSDPKAQTDLDISTQALKDALAALLAASQGAEFSSKECDDAIAAIQREIDHINQGAPNPGYEWGKAAEDIGVRANALSAALAQVVVAAKTNVKNLPNAAKASQAAFVGFVQALNAAIGASPNIAAKAQMADAAHAVGRGAVNTLSVAKFARQDPARMDRAYNEANNAVQNLMSTVDGATPGAAEIAEALKLIQDNLNKFDSNNKDAGTNRKILNENAKALSDTVAAMAVNARSQPEKLGSQAKEAAKSVSGVVVAANSLTPEYIDLAVPANQIQEKLPELASQRTVIAATKDIARSSSLVVAQSRAFIQNNPDALDANAKRELVDAAQRLAALCGQLAQAGKDWVRGNGSEENVKTASKNIEKQLANIRAINAKVQAKGKVNPALVQAARSLAEATSGLISTLKAVSARPKDQTAQSQMSASVGPVNENIKKVLDASNALVPGQKECDEAIQAIQAVIGDLAASSMSAAVGCYTHPAPQNRGRSVQECQEAVVDNAKDLAATTTKMVEASFKNPTQIGPNVLQISDAVARLRDATKDVAATTTDPQTQQSRLNMTKNLSDDALALVKAVKVYSVNPNPQAQQTMVDKAKAMRDAIAAIVAAFKRDVVGLRLCDEAYAAIQEHEKQLDQPNTASSKNYSDVRSQLQQRSMELVNNISKMLQEAQVGNADTVGPKSKEAAENIDKLMQVSKLAAGATNDAAAKQKLMTSARDVCRSTGQVVLNGKQLTEDPKNADKQGKMNQSFNAVTEAIRNITAAARAAAKGERDCEAAIEEIQKTNGEIETAALFAAGGIPVEAKLDPSRTLEDYSTELQKVQQALNSDATKMQSASSASLDDVGAQARVLAKDVAALAAASKNVVALLNNDVASKGMLNSAKSAGTASLQIVFIARELQTQPQADSAERLVAAREQLKHALADLQNISNEAAGPIVKALREIEKGKTSINTTLAKIDAAPGNSGAKAADVGEASRKIVAGNQGLVRALNANNYEEIAVNAKMQADGSVELLNNAKGASQTSPDPKVRADLMQATKISSEASVQLLEAAKTYRADDPEAQASITKQFDDANEKLQVVIAAARKLPEGENLDLNDDHLAKLAEQELANAAAQIEAAQSRIMAAPSRAGLPENELRQQDIAEGILEAARAITRATGALVNSAGAAQKELVLKGRANKLANPYRRDPAWAQGLISAAKEVASTTDQLVTDANAVVQKKVTEDHIIQSAKDVAGSTARLCAASKAKADPTSPTGAKLEVAARTVATATAKLVEAAKLAMQEQSEAKERALAMEAQKSAMVARKAQLDCQTEIARLEIALEASRKKLGDIQKTEGAGGVKGPVFVNLNVGAAASLASPKGKPPGTPKGN